MKKTWNIIIILVVFIVFGFFLLEKTQQEPQHIIISSVDRQVELDIPKDAIPDNLDLKDLTITPSQTTVPEGSLAAYDFEPSGTVFEKPIEITLQLEPLKPSQALPILVLLDGDTITPVPDSLYTLHEDGAAEISAHINHFSTYLLIEGFFVVVFNEQYDPHGVGESFDARLQVAVMPNRAIRYGGNTYKLLPDEEPSIDLVWYDRGAYVLGGEYPNFYKNKLQDGFYDDINDISCREQGDGTVKVGLTIYYSFSSIGPDGEVDEDDLEFRMSNRVELASRGECYAKDLTISEVLVKAGCNGEVEMTMEADSDNIENLRARLISSSGEVRELDINENGTITNIDTTGSPENPFVIELRTTIEPGEEYDYQIFELSPEGEEENLKYEGVLKADLCPIEKPSDKIGREGFDTDIETQEVETDIPENDLAISAETLMIQLAGGGYYPYSQFYTHDDGGDVTGCEDPHYRSNSSRVYGLESLQASQVISRASVDVEGCGFGKTSQHIPSFIRLTDEQFGSLHQAGASFELSNYIYPR